MRIVTLASVRGAPGVTTTALMLASALPDAVLVEADLDGGVLAVRYGLGREPGLTTLAASSPDDAEGWRAHAQSAGGVPVLVEPDVPEACASLWRTAGERITETLVAANGIVVVDAGRLRSRVPIVAVSDLLAVLVCPVAEQLVLLAQRLPTLRQAVRGQVAAVLVGNGPYRTADVEAALDVPVLGSLPDDPNAAETLRSGGPQAQIVRSRLARDVTALGAHVHAAVVEPMEITAR